MTDETGMDEWGSFRNVPLTWDYLADLLRFRESVSFCYSADNATSFIITIHGPIQQEGTMSWGGALWGKYLVSLRRHGSDYFNLRDNQALDARYVEEKLHVKGSDAVIIAELLNNMKKRMGVQ